MYYGDNMISLRLPEELEKKLIEVAKIENKSKSEVIKESFLQEEKSIRKDMVSIPRIFISIKSSVSI